MKLLATTGVPRTFLNLILITPMLICSQIVQAASGAFAFNDHSKQFGALKTDLNLDETALQIAAFVAGAKDPELTDLLSKIQQVRVLVYATDEAPSVAVALIDEYASALSKASWYNLLNKNEDGRLTRIFTQYENQGISGVVILRSEPEQREFMLVNIVGQIDAKQVQSVAEGLRLDLGY